jgi:hypothetical protein
MNTIKNELISKRMSQSQVDYLKFLTSIIFFEVQRKRISLKLKAIRGITTRNFLTLEHHTFDKSNATSL